MNEQFAAEMAADAPTAIREKVQGVLPDWLLWFDIDSSHRRRLEGEVCQLVTSCVKAAGAPLGQMKGDSMTAQQGQATTCINLKERFGDRYKVEHEESYHADRGENARTEDPWLQVLLCQHGHIYPHGRDVLAASTNTRGRHCPEAGGAGLHHCGSGRLGRDQRHVPCAGLRAGRRTDETQAAATIDRRTATCGGGAVSQVRL